MLKDRVADMMRGYVVVEYKWVLIGRIIFSCLVILITIALAGGVTVPAKTVNAASPITAVTSPDEQSRMFKPTVLQWMRDRSEMPEDVLSGIYDVVMKESNPDIILAICFVESGFNPVAKSRKGAMGLMGIRPEVWLDELKEEGIVREKRDLYAVPGNVAAGVYVFEKYLSKTKNIEKALFQYVGGDNEYTGKVLQALGEIYLARSFGREG